MQVLCDNKLDLLCHWLHTVLYGNKIDLSSHWLCTYAVWQQDWPIIPLTMYRCCVGTRLTWRMSGRCLGNRVSNWLTVLACLTSRPRPRQERTWPDCTRDSLRPSQGLAQTTRCVCVCVWGGTCRPLSSFSCPVSWFAFSIKVSVLFCFFVFFYISLPQQDVFPCPVHLEVIACSWWNVRSKN